VISVPSTPRAGATNHDPVRLCRDSQRVPGWNGR